MRLNKYIKRGGLAVLLLMAMAKADAQSQFSDILKSVEHNNPTLAAFGKRTEANKIGNHTGLAPDNPEVEFGLLPSTLGEGIRKDVSVTQSFDFPTAYRKRSRLAGAKDILDDKQLSVKRMMILQEAEEICINIVYLNAMLANRAERLNYAKEIESLFARKLKAGAVNQIEYNRSKLRITTLECEHNDLLLERNKLLSQLKVLNGGVDVNVVADGYESEIKIPSDFSQWLSEAESRNPEMMALRQEIEVAKRGVEVNNSEGLPRLSVGYAGEFTPIEGWQGVKIGVSVPLWANRNRVKQAKAEVAAAEQEMYDAQQRYISEMQYLISKARQLNTYIASYKEVLKDAEREELLDKALNAGEISLYEYFQEKDYFNEVRSSLLSSERDLYVTISRLNAYKL